MKKNFLKKLAFTMAFATAFTALSPAAGVFAAKAPSLNYKSKTLLLNDEDRAEVDLNIKNKVSGSTYKWTSSNTKVATVNAKNGIVEAQAIGKATISVKITLPTKKTVTLKAPVTVKENMETITITNLPKGAIKVGETHNFNRDYTTVTGGKTTDITRWVITSDNAADAEIKDNGFFTAKVPGVYTIKAVGAQSVAKYNEGVLTAESKELEVVVAGFTGLKQVDVDTVEAKFAAPVAKEDLSVYLLVSGNKVAQLVKNVTLSEDKKTATIDLYLPFSAEKTYGVEVKDLASKEFVAATQKVEDVDSIEVTTSTAVVNVATDVTVKLFNKDKVDITTDTLKNNVTISSSALNAYYDDVNKQITFYNVGDTTDITAVFHTYKYDTTTGEEIGAKKTVKTVVAVKAAETVTGSIDKSTVLLDGDQLDNFKTVNYNVPLKDNGAQLVVQLTETTGSTKTTYNNIDNSGYFTFESTDDTTLIVNPNGTLYTVKEGSAVVIVKYGKDASAEKAVVGAVTVNVVAERKVVDIKISTNVVTLSNSPDFGDSKAVTIQAVDRFGKAYDDQTKLEVTLLGNYTDAVKAELATKLYTTLAPNADGIQEITFKGVGVTKGTYQFKVTYGTIVKVITVTVNEPTGVADTDIKSFRLDLSTAKLDLKLEDTTTSKKVDVALIGLASNGVAIKEVAPVSGYAIEYLAPGSNTPVSVTNGEIDFLAGGVKAKTGTYVVRAYKPVTGGRILVATQTLEVVDTQEKVALAEVKNLTFAKSVGTVESIISSAFKLTLGSTEIDYSKVSKVNYTGSVLAGSVWVDSIEVTRTIAGVSVTDTVSVKLVIRFN